MGFLRNPLLSNEVVVFDLRLLNGEWNKDLLDQIFSPEDVKKILEVLLGSFNNADELIWSYSKEGKYNVRSGYRATMLDLDVAKT